MTNLINRLVIFIGSGLAIALIVFLLTSETQQAMAGVPIANEYHATTTVSTDGTNNLENFDVISSSQGALGSVIITGAGTGKFYLHDATTTNANLRTRSATTTIAIFPASSAVGTYVFDIALRDGLLIEYSGVLATSTITFR